MFPGKYHGGKTPASGLIFDGSGHLYGTAAAGGSADAGVVFELTPVAGGWVYSELYSFQGAPDGDSPTGSLVLDSAGNLYGTTEGGGTQSGGVVFELSPEADGQWSETVLQRFGGSKGSSPAGLVFDNTGNLYGTANPNVYELSPNGEGAWTEKVLFSFVSGGDTDLPRGPLVFDDLGNLYGVTEAGGTLGWGTVFELSPSDGGTWTEETLYNFLQNPDDGVQPFTGVTFDTAGNLFGVTPAGGGANGGGFGTVYKLSPSAGVWTESIIHRFHPKAGDGAEAMSVLSTDSAGNIYGTTIAGGAIGAGTAFRLSPNANGTWSELQHSFSGGAMGETPVGGVVLDSSGNLYGTTSAGGDGWGVIYVIVP